MIIPFLTILVAVALIAGDEDSSSASTAAGSDGVATSANGSSGGSTDAATAASEVGRTKPKIESSPGSEPRGLEATDLVVGTGAEATPGNEVTVHYVIVLNKNGKEVGSSWGSKPYSFELGSGRVTAGWEQGIEGMKEGGRRELVAPAELAYGKAGSKPAIGPNEDLLYVIDLVKVKPASAPGQTPQP
jgi:peptidylprolyl isomerase